MCMAQAPSIFISYRREDSAGHAGRLLDRFVQRFGDDHVFRDVEDIAAGDDFVRTLHQQVDRCGVLLALIGPRWLGVAAADGRPRLSDPGDWVRVEIARALARDIRVIPVLVGGAPMPAARDLPPDLVPLASRHATELREAHFDHDVEHLASQLIQGRVRPRVYRLAVAAQVAALLAVGGLGWYLGNERDPAAPTPDERATAAYEQVLRLAGTYSEASFVEAAQRGDARLVSLYLDAGMEHERATVEGYTALEWAAIEDHPRVAALLLERGARSDVALGYATGRGHRAVIEVMLAHPQSQAALDDGLALAAATDDRDLMRRLLRLGANPNADGGRSLMFVVDASLPALDLLIEHGGRLAEASDAEGRNPLDRLLSTALPETPASLDLLRRLIAAGLPIERVVPGSQIGGTPLLCALHAGRAQAAALLLEHGARADVRAQGARWTGYTPLMAAAQKNLPELVERLIAQGVPVNAIGTHGDSALTLAAEHADGVVVDALLEAGADTRARSERGLTALMIAAYRQHADMVERLLAQGAEVDAVDGDGNSALILAVSSNQPENTAIVQALLRHGARRDLRNAGGKSAMDIAEQRALHTMLRALRQAGPAAAVAVAPRRS